MYNKENLCRFSVVFDSNRLYQNSPTSRRLKVFTIESGRVDHYELVKFSPQELAKDLFRSPQGVLKYPYIVPGSTYHQLWDWDAFFCGLGVCEKKIDYFKGLVLNFLDHTLPDGRTPHRIIPEKAEFDSLSFPLFAQWCAAACRISGDHEWLRSWWDVLRRQRDWFEKKCCARRGLFRLAQWAGNGMDNDPVIYGRRPHTIGAVHVNCYHYREYQAMAYLARLMGQPQDSAYYHKKATDLADAINLYMWDERDGMYCHLDLSDHDDVRDQEITWELPYKIKSWACLYPLWAGICTPQQADRVIKEHVLNPGKFLSPFGIRSLSADERMYNNEVMADPSNWQGPVWRMSTFLMAYGLARYGYYREAEDIASRLIDVFACDLKTNGMLHEFYHADTGEPVMRPGFVSWNLLAVRILDDIRKRQDPSEIPA